MIRLVLTAVPLALSLNVSAKEFSVSGSYGFDWLKPESAKCRVLSPDQVAKFSQCEFTVEGIAFGLTSSHHTCVGSDRSEFLVYESEASCIEALETMNANAP